MRGQSSFVGGLLVLVLGAVGCSGQAEGSEPASDAPTGGEAIAHVELAMVDVGAGTIHFEEYTAPDGSKFVTMHELTPPFQTLTPFGRLMLEQDLTMLEVFRAIAPDREPPEALVEAHGPESQRLGRVDERVLAVTFDRDQPMEKSIASCEGWIWAPLGANAGWNNKQSLNNYTGLDRYISVGTTASDWGFSTNGRVTMGACNDGVAGHPEVHRAIDAQVAIDYDGDTTGWIYLGWQSVPTGSAIRWWDFQKTSPVVSCGPQFCYPTATHYAVACLSPGNICHLKTATRFDIIR